MGMAGHEVLDIIGLIRNECAPRHQEMSIHVPREGDLASATRGRWYRPDIQDENRRPRANRRQTCHLSLTLAQRGAVFHEDAPVERL